MQSVPALRCARDTPLRSTPKGYLDPAAPKKLMPRLNQLFNRAGLTQEEVHILRGIARAIEKTRPAADTPPALGGDE